ncbi:MAG: NAD(P)H-dependent oxidoreductase [Salinivirgaceae bacterium]|nr:NAD(P)H-dependent oxidoreductase [Salinivirgaceae bacterium]
MKRILIINGHPNKESFCNSLAENYFKGAVKLELASAKILNLYDLSFNPILQNGYQTRTELEPDLLASWELIKEANHIVFVYPNWWGTYPALLKGFIDRLFLPGFTFDYQNNSPLPKKLMKGKSASIIVTMDSPGFYYNLFLRKPGHNSMKKSILKFCGFSPVKSVSFRTIKGSTEENRIKWLKKAEQLGLNQF